MVQMLLKPESPAPQALLESEQCGLASLQHEPVLLLPPAGDGEVDG